MKVEKIDHVMIFVRDLERARKFFADLLDTEFSEPVKVKEADAISSMDPLGLELVTPLTPDGVSAKAMERRGEGLALLSLKVPNIDEAIAEMKSKGIRLVAWVERAEMKAAIFHPKDTYGMMIELTEYKAKHPVPTLL